MQKKSHSLLESLTNVIVGYLIALFGQILVFPKFGINIPLKHNIIIGIIFTFISLARSYTIRRIFTKLNKNLKKTK